VAVDAAGKIYVASEGNNTVTTYTANGTPTTPTITTGLDFPTGVAVH
jgi:DNA-binding beta-propeller fold protein YncE